MTLLKHDIQDHLTEPNPELAAQARASHPGMAHFAGTGPNGWTCRQCIFWEHSAHAYHRANGKHHGLIKPARCRKYLSLTGKRGNAVPDNAQACRHFQINNNAPARFNRG